MANRDIFSKRLKETREKTKMTQKDFAELVGSTSATISAYENATKNPSLDLVITIAEKCEVSIDWLCGFTDEIKIKPKVETYSDVVRLLLSLAANEDFEMKLGIDDGLGSKEYNGITIDDPTIKKFLEDWDKMKNLLENGSIDKELYNLWVEKTITKHDKKVQITLKIEGQYVHFDDNDCPF